MNTAYNSMRVAYSLAFKCAYSNQCLVICVFCIDPQKDHCLKKRVGHSSTTGSNPTYIVFYFTQGASKF